MYSTESSRRVAFQFKDPLAADQFTVCHVTSGICCRPNCDIGITEYAKQDLVFYDSLEQSLAAGYSPCPFCFPDRQLQGSIVNFYDGSHVLVDLTLIVETLQHVNRSIDFIPPLLAEESKKNSLFRLLLWKSTNQKLKRKLLSGVTYRTPKNSVSEGASVPTIDLPSPDSINLTKNEFDRLKLIDLACRHIALAASSTVPEVSVPQDALDAKLDSGKRRRRRGGVLGFKELAAKSNLSPWHFHRVFKSVTGLTPKNYGDRCCEYIKSQAGSPRSNRVIVVNTRVANPTLANEEAAQNSQESSRKSSYNAPSHHTASTPHTARYDTSFSSYSTSSSRLSSVKASPLSDSSIFASTSPTTEKVPIYSGERFQLSLPKHRRTASVISPTEEAFPRPQAGYETALDDFVAGLALQNPADLLGLDSAAAALSPQYELGAWQQYPQQEYTTQPPPAVQQPAPVQPEQPDEFYFQDNLFSPTQLDAISSSTNFAELMAVAPSPREKRRL